MSTEKEEVSVESITLTPGDRDKNKRHWVTTLIDQEPGVFVPGGDLLRFDHVVVHGYDTLKRVGTPQGNNFDIMLTTGETYPGFYSVAPLDQYFLDPRRA